MLKKPSMSRVVENRSALVFE